MASIFDPKDRAFKDGKISWNVENERVLSQIRQAALNLLDDLFPA